MATLIGNTTEEASNAEPGAGKILAAQFECTTEGTLEELHIISNKTWLGGEETFLGIAEEGAGVPGTFLESVHSVGKPKEKVAFALAGLSVKVKKGTKYWLEGLNQASAQQAFIAAKTAGSETVRASTKKFTKLETTSEWLAAKKAGPLTFWGTGTESGSGTTAACKTKVTLLSSANPSFNATVGATAHFAFADKASVIVTTQAQALTKLRFQDSATPTAIMQARASAKIVIADSANASQIQQAVGKARLVFTGSATTAEGEGAGRHVVVFIFDD